jgi:hypothetical protein
MIGWRPYPTQGDVPYRVQMMSVLRIEDISAFEALRTRIAALEAGGGGGGATTLDGLTDVVITAPVVGEVLIYDGAEWVNDFYTSYFP